MLGLGILLLISRIPLLTGGFGSDDDSWRNVVTAIHMHEAGRYIPSRAPGFPVYEGLLFALVPLGSVATNAASVLAQLAATFFLLRIAQRLRLPAPGWIAAAFALAPSVWVNTTQTMDYALTLALFLAAADQLLQSRWRTAGALLALAAGSRASMGLMIVPSVLFAWMSSRSRRVVLSLGTSFAFAVIAVFLPVFLAPETGELRAQLAWHAGRHHAGAADLLRLGRGGIVLLIGKVGAFGLTISLMTGLILKSRPGAKRAPSWGRPTVTFVLLAILIVAALFVLIPYDPAYLLPVLPLGLLLAGWLAERRTLALAALLIASEVFVTPLLGAHRLVPGRLPLELSARSRDREKTARLVGESPAGLRVFVIGRFGILRLVATEPRLERTGAAWALFGESGVALWNEGRRVGYAAALTAQERQALIAVGYRISDLAPQ